MAVPVARVHLKVAHAALPALLPTPPKWKMLPLLSTPQFVAANLPKPAPAKPSRADADERWDARKTKPANAEPSANSVSNSVGVGHGSSLRKNASSPPLKPGRADSVDRWDAHKKEASPASSSGERWDMHKKRRLPPQAESLELDGGERSSTASNDIDDTEEEILWKPRAMYAGSGIAVAAPGPSMLPSMPTAFMVRVV